MDKLLIEGGARLSGEIAISGAKNPKFVYRKIGAGAASR